MTTFNIPSREEVSPASQTAFDVLQKALGMVPNLYATIALSDNGLPRYLAYQGGKTSLSNKEKEVVNLVVSQINGCKYCLSAHTVLGKMNGLSDEEIILIRKGSSSDPKLNALVAVTRAITEHRGHVASSVLDGFFAAGYNKGSLVDVILQVSDKIAMNYLHNLTEVAIDFPLAPELNLVPGNTIRPPFTYETALQKVQLAEDAWNTRDPEKICLAYTVDTQWRNRSEFINGREEVKSFLRRKWAKELDYRLKKELWGFRDNRMAVRFEYEWHDREGQWYRSYGNELWEFDEEGLMRKRFASINDLPIGESERRLK